MDDANCSFKKYNDLPLNIPSGHSSISSHIQSIWPILKTKQTKGFKSS